MLKPLAGVNVLDLSRILAGPYAAQSLADLGATVRKIEAPWGDDTRSWGPPFQTGFDGQRVASYFLSCNRGKSIHIHHLREDQHILREFVEQADVIIENFRPGTFERFIPHVPSSTIVCSISGYGQHGPRCDQPAFDLTMQAQSGIMSITGQPGQAPVKVGVAWIDIMTGMNAVSGILAALIHRQKTGKGARIDISLWDTAIAALANQAHNAMAGHHPVAMGSSHPNLVPYKVFQCQDGWFALGIGTPSQWQEFLDVMSLSCPDSWMTNEGRLAARMEVEQFVGDALLPYSKTRLEHMLSNIPCSRVNSVQEALHDDHSVHRGCITQYQGVEVLASPLRFIYEPNEKSVD